MNASGKEAQSRSVRVASNASQMRRRSAAVTLTGGAARSDARSCAGTRRLLPARLTGGIALDFLTRAMEPMVAPAGRSYFVATCGNSP
jgi:hypothetical protein